MERVRALAGLDVPILIEGEAGTGVEFVAREIHALSPRRGERFVAISCIGVPHAALNGLLLGHAPLKDEPEDRPGLFESAEGGTVFIEEICDVPLDLQLKLVRMLNTREVNRIGDSRPRRVNVRLICGTHFDLNRAAGEGRLRPDLLYKIRVAQVRLPALRERVEDLPPLIAYFLHESRLIPDHPPPSLSDEAMGLLLAHDWPGNMLELQSAIEYAVLHCGGALISKAGLPPELRGSGPRSSPEQSERARFETALRTARNNRTQAARLLGISRATLYRRLKELGITERG